jgi:putative colanic acid biosynthesis UDP-glucose lipid carrier transferase
MMRATRRRYVEGWYGRVVRQSASVLPLQERRRPPDESPLIIDWRQPVAPVARSRCKRAFDVLVAGFALLFLAPFLLLVGAAIAVESGGPVLFRQERTGYRGRVFTIFKFRTMTVVEHGSVSLQATRGDVRVTRIGFILRKLSLDELPQLLNVVRGEMSLIGPRPHATGHDANFARAVPGYADRFNARPGLTGLAQVNGHRGEIRSVACIAARVANDRDYIRRWSLWLDLQILLRTVPLLFGDPKAY